MNQESFDERDVALQFYKNIVRAMKASGSRKVLIELKNNSRLKCKILDEKYPIQGEDGAQTTRTMLNTHDVSGFSD